MIRLDLLDVGFVEETGSILVVLRSPQLARLLVLETGLLEGQAIALAAEGMRSDRPLTQDLLHAVITQLGARVEEVRINEFRNETFFAKVVLLKPDGASRVEIDARPSDAVALALRAGAHIYVNDEVMEQLGVPEKREGRFADLYAADADPDRTVH